MFHYTYSLFVIIQCSGYVPPEYARRGIYSTKSDVYSFGVLLLQIISGKKVSILYGENDNISLLDYVNRPCWKSQNGTAYTTIPKKPAFSRLTDENEQCKSLMHLEACSVDDATISEVVAR
ncbi:hypothetical protein ACOSP7_012441 [Xanthoceras sorbifolium]